MPRPIRRQYENATFSDFGQRLRGFGEGFLANVRVAMAHGGRLVSD